MTMESNTTTAAAATPTMVHFGNTPKVGVPPIASNDNTNETAANHGVCLKCHDHNITYECDPCGCPAFCNTCAPKLASGGRCKICKEFYGGLRRIRQQDS